MCKQLQNEVYPYNPEQVYKDIAIIQMFGYTSKKFVKYKELYNLPSHIFTLQLIKYLAEKRNTTFLIMRHIEEWKNQLSTVIDIKKYGERFIFNKSHMGNQHLTKKVLGNNYSKVVDTLKRE